jgi:regulatory protein
MANHDIRVRDPALAGAPTHEADEPSVGGASSADASTTDGGLGEEDRRYRLALDRALRLLGQREHSVRELTAKLTGKGIDAATAGLVVDDLRGRGLQSDARFTEAFVHSRVGRGQGPIRIRQELGQRGIGDDLADELLTRTGDYWLELAQRTRIKKFGDAAPADRHAWNRQARYLARRGFPSDLIYRVLGNAD